MKRVTLLFALALGAFGCKEKLDPPKVVVESVVIGSMSPAGADIDTTLDVTNGNKVELSATGAETKVTIGGKPDVARASLTSPLVLPAGQRNKLRIPIKVEWTSAPAIAELAAKKEQALYTVDGFVEFSSRAGNVRAPFQINGTMTAAELAKAAGVAPAESSAPAASASSARPSASAKAKAK
jgi:hypothetical protein